MTRSGQAVQAIVDFYKIPHEDILILFDDMDLPSGQLRLRQRARFCQQAEKLAFAKLRPQLIGQVINGDKPQIVPGVLVFRTWVAQADD